MQQGSLFSQEQLAGVERSLGELVDKHLVLEDAEASVGFRDFSGALVEAEDLFGRAYSDQVVNLLLRSAREVSGSGPVTRRDVAGLYVTVAGRMGDQRRMRAWRERFGVTGFGEAQYAVLCRYVSQVADRK